jgi:tetratricopeptide (TPR) repeat protein
MRIESLHEQLSQFPNIDNFWDFENLQACEQKIRALLVNETSLETAATSRPENLILLARVQGLQRLFTEAASTLQIARSLLRIDEEQSANSAEIKFLIEQGRLFSLSMNHSQSLTYYLKAWEQSLKLNDPYYSIEAAMLLSISQSPKLQNEWLKKAIDLGETTQSMVAKKWLPILYAMDGWNSFDFRRFDESLQNFKKSLESLIDEQSPTVSIGLRWNIARALRALNRNQEALDLQVTLSTELSLLGKTNGHIYLEIAECNQALKKFDEAKTNFELAYKILSLNSWYADNKPSELSRLQHLSKKK